MAKTFYTESVDAEGNKTYTPVANPLAEIDNELFFGDERYRGVVAESVQRRQKIAELNAQLAAPAEQTVVTPVLNEDELFAKFSARFEAREVEKQTRQQTLRGLMEQHKLPDAALPLLELSADPNSAAALLGREKFLFQSTPTGDTTQKTEVPDLVAEMRKELGLN